MKKRIILVIFIISLITLSFSFYGIIKWKNDNEKTLEEAEKIYKNVDIQEKEDSENVQIIGEDIKKEDPYWDYIKFNLIDVDFTDLKRINEDVKGWILVNGTNINYPFVQTNNNDYYLNHSIDNTYNDAGWVFMDFRNNDIEFQKNTILYAHGRLDKSMFGSLRNIMKSDWYNDVNNHIIKLSTPYENTLWQVFSVYHIPTTNDYIQTTFTSNNQFSNFINTLKDRSAYEFNTSVSVSDKILTLSTCYNDEEKVVLHAKLIKKDKR